MLISSIALIAFCAFLHRVRGGLFKLPFDIKYYCPPFFGLALWLYGMPWYAAIVWAVGYLLWIIPGYMEEIDEALGVTPAGQVTSNSIDVRFITLAAFGNPYLEVFLRATIYLVPLCIAMVYCNENPLFLLIIVAVFYPAYVVGYLLIPRNPAIVAETAIGASWGGSAVLALSYLLHP